MLGAPDLVPKSAITETDMWDPLLHWARLSNTHRERQREETVVPFLYIAPEVGEVAGAAGFGLARRTAAVGGPTDFTAARRICMHLRRGPRWPVASWPWM
jgi:hypothetical protein